MEKFTSVICAIVKNEQRFIREWVEHYLNIGFDKLYVFEDFGSKTHAKQIQDLIDEGKVVLNSLDASKFIPRYKRGTTVQRQLYDRFLKKCKKEKLADWIGFFDVDEFMMFEDGYDLQRLEEEFSSDGAVILPWRLYGANGHIKRPKGGVVESYTSSLEDGSQLNGSWQWSVKSLVNVAKCTGLKHIHVFKPFVLTDHTKDCRLCFKAAWLNHYYTKSWEDYLDRIFARGNMQNNFRCLDNFFKISPEFAKNKEKMVMEQRYRHTASTMWISRDMKIISGGNEAELERLRKKYIQNK